MGLLLSVKAHPPHPPHPYWQEIKDLSSDVSGAVSGNGFDGFATVCKSTPPPPTSRRSKTSAPMLHCCRSWWGYRSSCPPPPPHFNPLPLPFPIKDLSSDVSNKITGVLALIRLLPATPQSPLTGRRSKTSAPMLATQSQVLALTGSQLSVNAPSPQIPTYRQEIKDLSSDVSDAVTGAGPDWVTAVCKRSLPPNPHLPAGDQRPQLRC